MDEQPDELRERLLDLATEHRDLDSAIAALVGSGVYDPLRAQRLKKRKLALKDEIARLESALLPDISA